MTVAVQDVKPFTPDLDRNAAPPGDQAGYAAEGMARAALMAWLGPIARTSGDAIAGPVFDASGPDDGSLNRVEARADGQNLSNSPL